ncbi:type VI secretion protein [Piscirickettsia salmonis]|uniref:Type VI secretion protein, EvpB/ family n=1 Tax=Piscirickettsia salmonis TaxID=1238 RepID=A0A9Q5VK89_PISSA|nr:type VI secretion system contractile sheath large subunit [Piscirickettsia salmonis]ALA24104.1 Type VI secretion system protein VC_A0108 [Piscirickettsia salmonis]APS44505.1 type VI secretion protein [Piscirickettsia salmonis]APS47866.1 type VI secretion protein [Piscirickettsia salmonis]APS51823.1 type VI secretion protein [Piscirickettsia salmonis]APS55042.1 type VI secretion protein [Piscirickettsia salmonis]
MESTIVDEQVKEDTILIEDIIGHTNIAPDTDEYVVVKQGITALVGELQSKEEDLKNIKIDRMMVDLMIAKIDEILSAQVDEILHNEKFQNLESSWRGLKYVVDQTDFRENTKIEIVNISKDDLIEDFEDSPEVVKSGLYKIMYTSEYGQFGGEPYASVLANYSFNQSTRDIQLLENVASIAAMSHAPFIASAAESMFGLESYEKLPNLKDLHAIFEGPMYTKWRSFREREDSRYIGLTLPRFMLRIPYDPEENPCKSFRYTEEITQHTDYLWGNSSFAFATRLTDSFAQFRWCPNITGPTSGGAVSGLPIHLFDSMGEIETKIPTEVLVSDRREFELSEEGFIPLSFKKGTDKAVFFSASSIQKPKFFGTDEDARMAEMNYRLGTQLPYMFIICRIAHYLKVIQRENIGSWRERADLEKELNKWINQFVVDQDNVSASIRSRKPLRKANVKVSEVPGNAGWYSISMNIRPHFKYMGSDITLSLVGRLEQD